MSRETRKVLKWRSLKTKKGKAEDRLKHNKVLYIRGLFLMITAIIVMKMVLFAKLY
jgi:hypothetical protein